MVQDVGVKDAEQVALRVGRAVGAPGGVQSMDCWKHRTCTGDGGVHDGFEVWPDASAEGVCWGGWWSRGCPSRLFSWRPELATKLCWALERAGSQRGNFRRQRWIRRARRAVRSRRNARAWQQIWHRNERVRELRRGSACKEELFGLAELRDEFVEADLCCPGCRSQDAAPRMLEP